MKGTYSKVLCFLLNLLADVPPRPNLLGSSLGLVGPQSAVYLLIGVINQPHFTLHLISFSQQDPEGCKVNIVRLMLPLPLMLPNFIKVIMYCVQVKQI